MKISKRDFMRLTAGGSAAALIGQLGRSASVAQTTSGFRAMVGIFLFGGSDNWNMIVPTDSRYTAYAANRGASLALPLASLTPLAGVPYGLHPSLAPLSQVWADGALSPILNVGSLYQPLTKAQYQSTPTAVPLNLMSHADQQNQWQGLRMRDVNNDGFMGRQNDREVALATPDLISLGGSSLAVIGETSSPLILPSTGTLVRNGYNAAATDAPTQARQSALSTFSTDTTDGLTTQLTGQTITAGYSQAVTANAILTATTSTVDQHFVNPTTGAALTSDVSHQLLRVARMIEARSTLGHTRQVFFASQGGYDTHSNEVDAGSTTTGTQANLFNDLAMAMAGFYAAMKGLGLQNNVTTFTMSEFARTYKVNAQRGTDHAWGSNHLVMGGALTGKTIHGAYPDVTLGGTQDIDSAALGRWIPTLAIEEYIGSIAQWYGVAAADMTYVFPNWTTWSTNGRGPVPFFK